jgi:HlyD family secretion protein
MRAWNGPAFAALALIVGAACLASAVHDAGEADHGGFVSSAQAQPAPIRRLIDWLRGLTLPAGIVKAEGRIEATQIDVSSKYAGEVVDVAVREGDKVTAGQVIARLSSPTVEAQLAAAQSELRSAKDAGAQGTVKAAEAKVEQIKSMIAELTLVSPSEGKVQYRLAHVGESLAAGATIVTLIDLADVYMTVFVRAADAHKLAIADQARIILDAFPDYVVPATVGFVASDSPAASETAGAKDDPAKQMLRVDLKIDPKVVETYYGKVETGLRGAGFVRTRSEAKWPADLQVKLPPAPVAPTPTPTPAAVAQEVASASAPNGGASGPSAPAAPPTPTAIPSPVAEVPTSGPAAQTVRAGAPASETAPAPVAEATAPAPPPPEPKPASSPPLMSALSPAPLAAASERASGVSPAAREANLAAPSPALPAPLASAPVRAPATHALASARLGPEPRAEFAPESLAQLAGAWTQSAADCRKLFQRRGSALTFRQPVDQFAQAAIIESQRIRLPSGVCRIERASFRGGALEVSGECQDSISYTPRSAYVKLKSKNELVFNPSGDSTLDVLMTRCSL